MFNKITPAFIREWTQYIKEKGFRSFIKKKGWRFLLAVIVFYTVRDGVIYVLIPYLAYKGIISR